MKWIVPTIVVLIAIALLYYGGVMLFLVPGDVGEKFLSPSRVAYGLIPFMAGLALGFLALWIGKKQRQSN